MNKEAVKEYDLKDMDITNGKDLTHITITAVLDGKECIGFNRRKRSKTGNAPSIAIKDELKIQYKKYFESNRVPLVLYYGTNRIVKEVPRRGHIREYKLEDSVKNCFNNDNYFREFYEWFKTEEDIDLREKREDETYKNPRLECVRLAIAEMIPEYSNLRIKLNPSRMVVSDKKGNDLRIEQLSDGYKATLSMVADIAKRLSMAYPDSLKPLEEEAIIMIDELDLHLHPKWQTTIVDDLKRTFKNCQFIVSTHSPFIIQSVDKIEVINLDDDIQETIGGYQGWSLEEIQEYTMKVYPKTDRYSYLLKLFQKYVDEDNYENAKKLYIELKEMTHPANVVMKILDADMRSMEYDD